jgi:hypothetical protein
MFFKRVDFLALFEHILPLGGVSCILNNLIIKHKLVTTNKYAN